MLLPNLFRRAVASSAPAVASASRLVDEGLALSHIRSLSGSASCSAPVMPAFSHAPAPYQGPSAEEVLRMRKAHLSPCLFLHFKKPVMIVEGKMQYLFDERGRRYLDAFAGIVTVSVGHCHPEVVKAVNEQSTLLQHTTTIYLNPQVALYAKELADKMPGNLKVVYFVNSGSEANDMAMMLARAYTGNWDVICLRNGYHGMSMATMGACGHATWKQPVPQSFGILHAMNPDPYHGAFGNDGLKYVADLKDQLLTSTSGQVAGFMAETIQGVGGTVPLASGYLPAAYKLVKEAGGVCIADEVQTGFGRTGAHYWGFESQGVMPDIVTMAKGIGNGLPLAAVVTTPEIASSMAKRLHFNTFGGNPVCSAGGRAVLRVLDAEQRQAHCASVGAHLVARLKALQSKHEIIGDVRGQGLMLGVELVKDRATKEPAKVEIAEAMERMKDMGVLMGKGGLAGNVFRIKPPMCFSKQDADFLADASPLEGLGQKLATAGAAVLLTLGNLGAPALANEFDVIGEPAPSTHYYVDDANVLSRSTRGDIDKQLKLLEIETGYRVTAVTVRKLEFEPDTFAFADKIVENWYPNAAEGDNKGVVLVVTAGKEGAVSGGKAFMEKVGEPLVESIVSENVPIYSEQEKYNQCVTSVLDRIDAQLKGNPVPEAPTRADATRNRTYKTKEEVEKSKTVTSTVVATLLIIAVVVPMLQYYGYTARD